MARQLTRTSRLLGVALALALALVSSVTCFAATLQMVNAQKHACCTMGQECGKTPTIDCCATQTPSFAGLAPAALANVVAPPVDVISSMLVMPESSAAWPAFAFDSDASKPPGTPTYLLVSVFRL